ncbi:MAG: hypothetical protein J1F31_03545 [Erysipelotrichales bacterium]|nr:hypothetical protein [Erysipelotrichales bacterium]
MDKIERNIKQKKVWSIILLVVSAITLPSLGAFGISFLKDHLTNGEGLYKLGMIIVMIPFAIIALVSLACIITSIIIQSKLKGNRSLAQYIISFITLVLIIAFCVLYFVVLLI